MERDPLSVIDILYEGALDEDAWRRGLLAVADLGSASRRAEESMSTDRTHGRV